MVRGAPGRGSSASPSRRAAAKRSRHLRTVGGVTRKSRAMAVLGRPSAAARTMRARKARRWALVGRLAQAASLLRSSSVRVNGIGCGPRDMRQGLRRCSGDPVSAIPETRNELLTQDTSGASLGPLAQAVQLAPRADEQAAAGDGRAGQAHLTELVAPEHLEVPAGLDHERLAVLAQAEDLAAVGPR